ncbi:uncharacterized protein LOC123005045 [Tribolium madens]|uniref:uncharacterized protein LOC123005045 n=1 Tax=Tribolium madens TaxID=41895 RepID=UPI001CF73172|nr:uncharacterized protein LOC123005045 [Tribolium madens]
MNKLLWGGIGSALKIRVFCIESLLSNNRLSKLANKYSLATEISFIHHVQVAMATLLWKILLRGEIERIPQIQRGRYSRDGRRSQGGIPFGVVQSDEGQLKTK